MCRDCKIRCTSWHYWYMQNIYIYESEIGKKTTHCLRQIRWTRSNLVFSVAKNWTKLISSMGKLFQGPSICNMPKKLLSYQVLTALGVTYMDRKLPMKLWRVNALHDGYRRKSLKFEIIFSKNQEAVSRNNASILGLFVLILKHFSGWIQIWQ